MKQIFCQLLSCWTLGFFIAASDVPAAHPGLIRVSDASLCIDSMETVPMDDDLVPTEVAVDGGCMLSSQDVISV